MHLIYTEVREKVYGFKNSNLNGLSVSKKKNVLYDTLLKNKKSKLGTTQQIVLVGLSVHSNA